MKITDIFLKSCSLLKIVAFYKRLSETDNSQGISYVEVLIAVIFMAICLVPAIESLHNSTALVKFQEQSVLETNLLTSKTEEVLSKSFVTLDANATAAGSPTVPTGLSDNVTVLNQTITRLVYIWPYDGDNADLDSDPFTGTDSNLLYVKVEIEGKEKFVETLTNNEAE